MLVQLRNHPGIIVSSLLMIALLVWGFWPQPLLVESATAKHAPLTITIEEEGRTRIIDHYIIAAPVNGVTCRLHLKVGDHVELGQTLLGITPLASQVLDPRSRAQAKAQVATAESALRVAQEQARVASVAAQLANTDLKRYQPLLEKGLIAQGVFDTAATQAQSLSATKRSANFGVEVARHQLESARTTLEYSSTSATDQSVERVAVRSPINGQILKVARSCEGPVKTGEALLEVGDPTSLEIEVDVLSADAVKIKPGMKVFFERWGGTDSLEGQVRLIEPIGFTKISALGVEEQRVLIISDFTSPAEQWQRLGDGYRVEASFVLWHKEDVLQVPASSLFRYNNGWALFVIEDDHAKRREVTIGQRNGLQAQILEGITAGERVINHPSEAVEDNISIKLNVE
jgi:HlyD family secretion protein